MEDYKEIQPLNFWLNPYYVQTLPQRHMYGPPQKQCQIFDSPGYRPNFQVQKGKKNKMETRWINFLIEYH